MITLVGNTLIDVERVLCVTPDGRALFDSGAGAILPEDDLKALTGLFARTPEPPRETGRKAATGKGESI